MLNCFSCLFFHSWLFVFLHSESRGLVICGAFYLTVFFFLYFLIYFLGENCVPMGILLKLKVVYCCVTDICNIKQPAFGTIACGCLLSSVKLYLPKEHILVENICLICLHRDYKMI